MTTLPPSSTAPEPATPALLTLGVMARAPVAGRCKTRLAGALGAEPAARLYEAMLVDTLEALSILPARHVLLAAPEDDGLAMLRALAPRGWEVVAQRGDGLGARLTNALRDLCREHDLVCLLDSDSPTLPMSTLAEGLSDLRCRQPGTVVAGPCDDGGYYLIGMRALEVGVFENIPWSTPHVMATTRARCAELGLTLVELPTWFDVDEPSDVDRLAADLARDATAAPRTAAVIGELGGGRGARASRS